MKHVLPLLLFFASFSISAQDVLDNNPPSLRWYQIQSPHFRIIFPEGFEVQGQRMANTLEHIREPETRSLGGALPRKISVILQNQSAISNGFVSVFPRRSEFFGMPTQDYNFGGTNDWLDLLAVHEYRHIAQYQHALRGFNRLFYYLFGANGFGAMANAAAPNWFWEGDAVAIETAVTPSGRGRIPNFSLLFRTNLLEGRKFNYHKQLLQSYKHEIPNHYVLGYHMVSYLRERTGDPNIWGKVSARSWRVPFIPFAFSNALKKESGMYATKLYREMANDLQTRWEKDLANLSLTSFENVHQRNNTAYTDFSFPQAVAPNQVVALKSGIGDIQEFVLLSPAGEKKIFTPGIVNPTGMISASGNLIVWNEFGFDPRWRVRTYSLIKAFDRVTGQKYVVGSKQSRYAGSSVSPDGTRIVTVETDVNYQTKLLILSFPDGAVQRTFENADNSFYSMPRFSDDGSSVVVLKTGKKGRSIVVMNASTGVEREVLFAAHENVGYPVLHQQYVLFNSPVTGIDNIYALNLNDGQRYQVTSSKYGAYNPSISADGMLYYNEQTRDGLQVVRMKFDPENWKPFVARTELSDTHQHLEEQETAHLLDSVPSNVYPVKRYSAAKGLFNPYAWGLVVNQDLSELVAGVSSRNIMSTTDISAAYVYNVSERAGGYRAAISYQGWYPVLDLSASVRNRKVNEGNILQYDTTVTPAQPVVRNLTFDWREKNIEGGFRIPLNTTSSRFIGNFTIGNYIGVTEVSQFRNNIDNFDRRIIPVTDSTAYFFLDYVDRGRLLYNRFTLSSFRILKQSRRDINPKWGQAIFMDVYSTPYGGNFTGNLFSFTGYLYFPGIFKHHSLWGYWAYQNSRVRFDEETYLFPNQVPIQRGISVSRWPEYYSMSVNYTLPVWYPDIAVGPLLNIQRLRANMFLDYGFGSSAQRGTSQSYSSVGVEAKLDINILRFLPQLDIGVRYSIGLEPATSTFEFLLGTINF